MLLNKETTAEKFILVQIEHLLFNLKQIKNETLK